MLLRTAPLLLVCLLALPCRAEPGPAHLLPETLQSVVFVRAGDSTGTAFLLRYKGGRYLVTARHVVDAHLEDPQIALAFLVGGKHGRPIREVRLLGESRRSDLAVFAFEEDPTVPYFKPEAGFVPSSEVHLAQAVFLVGYPASLRQTYGSSQLRVVGGWIAGLKKYVPGSTVEYVDVDMAGVEHGHSGGPLLLLQDRVLGVAVQRRTGSVTDTIGATYAVPIQYATSLIDKEPVKEDLNALRETLRGTTLVAGLALHGKDDYDIWVQRVHRDTGEAVWGDVGVFAASSPARESELLLVPSDDGSYLVIHASGFASGDHDIYVQKVSPYGELLVEEGMRSRGVATSGQSERHPAAVSDGADGAIVAYEHHLPDGDMDVRAQRLDPEGTPIWDEGGVGISTAKLVEGVPVVVSDGSGGAIVLLEMRHENGDVDIMAQRVRADGTLAWHEGKKSAVVAASKYPEFRPRALPDGDGGAVVVYELEVEDGRRAVLAQRVSRHGELLWGGGEGSVLVTQHSAAGDVDGIDVMSDGMGGAFVAIEIVPDPANPQDVDLVVQRITASGTLAWGEAVEGGAPPPVLAASSAFPERRPHLSGDGQGGLVVVFESGSQQGDTDIMGQRVDAAGNLRWHGGTKSAEVALTLLSERAPRLVERHGDRVLVVFEMERENGRSIVACQALSLATGDALYGGGRFPVAVVDPGEMEISCLLKAPPVGD